MLFDALKYLAIIFRDQTRRRLDCIAVVVVAISTLFCVLLGEVALHSLYRYKHGSFLFSLPEEFQVPYVQSVDDRRRYTLKKNAAVGRYEINEEGFRGSKIKKGGTPIVCVVGDSVPFGVGVDNQETFPWHLERVLANLGLHYRVLNGGVPSYNLRQSMDRWRFDIRGHYECVAIILTAANDVSLMEYFGRSWSIDSTWAEKRFGVRNDRRWSSTLYYARVLLDSISQPDNGGERGRLNVSAIADIRHELEVWITELEEQHIPLLMISINPCYAPNEPIDTDAQHGRCHGHPGYEILRERWEPKIEAVNNMMALAQRPDVYFLDVREKLRQISSEEDGSRNFVDFIHLSNDGAQKLAKMVADEIEKRQILVRKSP